MSDREIYSHSGSLASLIANLKNGQRGIDAGSGDWVFRDYAGVLHAARSYKSYSGSVWNYSTIPTGLTGSRALTTDAGGNLAVSSVTLTELNLLSGKTSLLGGSGTTGRVPYFTAAGILGNSPLYSGTKSVRLMAAPSAWGSSFAAFELGLNALWGNPTVQNGFGSCLSSNRYHDGVNNKPYVSGLSVSYDQDGGQHSWTSDQGLTAGVGFTPTERMRLDFNGLFLSSLTASRAVAVNSSGYLYSTPVTTTELGHLAGVTSAIQTQLNGKLAGSALTANYLIKYNGTAATNSEILNTITGLGQNLIRFGNSAISYSTTAGTKALTVDFNATRVAGLIPKAIDAGASALLMSNADGFFWSLDNGLSAGEEFLPTYRMQLTLEGLYLSSTTASRALVTNASKVVVSSSVTSTELGHLAGVTSAIQTQLNGKLAGSGTATYIPVFTSNGTLGDSRYIYTTSPVDTHYWGTAAAWNLMALTNSALTVNTRIKSFGLNTGHADVIAVTNALQYIDLHDLTYYNLKLTTTGANAVILYNAVEGDILHLTNIGTVQISVHYDGDSAGPTKELYPGQTMQLLCINTYGSGEVYSTWAIWRADANPSWHLND